MTIETQKYFTKTEANNALCYVRKITEDIIRKWEAVLSMNEEERTKHLGAMNKDAPLSLAGNTLLIDAIQYHTKELEKVGCRIQDFSTGMVLFPTLVRGREGYLVWQYGEHTVERVYEKAHTHTI
jgi:hypothetical protein